MTKSEKKQVADQLRQELKNAGYEVIYGGTKGHGFWVRGMGWKTVTQCRKLLKGSLKPCNCKAESAN